MMTLMTPMVMKHTVIIPTVVDSENPVDEKDIEHMVTGWVYSHWFGVRN